ncbi:putative O-linked N-acetylglucosamine transferase, SPINDLY family; TPR domain protein [Bradyrhizobium sp. ORS 285]|uniref:tetratricopeptide repeat protein n=1 Tax=Bradyrhizobium sp. ORS 285 TaxID=115808 RepID=UPI0002408FC7|nr:glycosyltransferase family 41 protein [Bradyrhizobium sp. ORS 285]CCD88645.1 putative O-linked N-acetylglucosamine transferase, SPINDLY family; TPR domain protein [Bradyrhizobium sp. ORS 285]SMX56251.1 putative O-linked N-acetylglucosamine transferase, SPINDLY family; TPR domain protein [Bradyrhizobium sp. ORS 285]
MSTVGSRAFQKARQEKKQKKLVETQLTAAFIAFRAGRQADTQAICAKLLQEVPGCFEAVHLLGVSLVSSARFAEATTFLAQAVALEPNSADAQSNLGWALVNCERFEEARAALERSLALRPNAPITLRNLTITLLRLKQGEAALASATRALELKPDDVDSWCNRSVAELMLRRWDGAAASAEQALVFNPTHFEALVNKGLAHLELHHFEQAEATFNTALAARPMHAELLAHRGRLYMISGRTADAEADYDRAVALDPNLQVGWQGKAQISLLNGNIAQAIAACKRVLDTNPKAQVALTLLGACRGKLGDVAGAVAQFDQALEVQPDYDEAITKKIFYLDFLPGADFAVQQAARHYWWVAIGSKFPRRTLAPRSLDPIRRIVVGYVSADFRTHSAAFAFLPVLRGHDKTQVQVNCYSTSPRHDAFTENFKSIADVWVEAANLSDDELADRIQADGVDILVDLSGYTTGTRMPVFARKPAPIQVTAWGSGTGTGLATMDYFFADPVTVPASVRPLFAERVHDLPSVITIDPLLGVTPSPPPMLQNGHVTFGVYNRIDKISDEAIVLWARLLAEVPDAKLVIKHLALNDPLVRDGLIGRFVSRGVPEARLVCLGASERSEHLKSYERIDISLDPFPQNGGISTFESLYMGVPVVAKLGAGAASRAAGGILTAAGLADWVGDDDDGYIRIAKTFAAQPELLSKLRAELPGMVARSPAGDVANYTRCVESAYRQFWQTYCAKTGA